MFICHGFGSVFADHTRFVGVAPEANLLSFKVFGTDGYSNEETVIEGFLKAFESGVSDEFPSRPLCKT